VRVVKQRIWVDGAEYDLQEIYGMEVLRGQGGGGVEGAGGEGTRGRGVRTGLLWEGQSLRGLRPSPSSDLGVECVIGPPTHGHPLCCPAGTW